MRLRAVLFDLDGTLLEYDLRKEFLPNYFNALGAYFAHDIDPEKLVKGIMLASDAISQNAGLVTNEQAFSRVFYPFVNRTKKEMAPAFHTFYQDVFPTLQQYAKQKPCARDVIATAFALNLHVVIATNPYFPETAVMQRLAWADVHDFPYDKVTTYENSHFAKPDTRYFDEIMDELGVTPSETLVVGDEAMDMVAGLIGCQTFLVTSEATEETDIHPIPTFKGKLNEVTNLLSRLL